MVSDQSNTAHLPHNSALFIGEGAGGCPLFEAMVVVMGFWVWKFFTKKASPDTDFDQKRLCYSNCKPPPSQSESACVDSEIYRNQLNAHQEAHNRRHSAFAGCTDVMGQRGR
jgi:hypothetical protein